MPHYGGRGRGGRGGHGGHQHQGQGQPLAEPQHSALNHVIAQRANQQTLALNLSSINTLMQNQNMALDWRNNSPADRSLLMHFQQNYSSSKSLHLQDNNIPGNYNFGNLFRSLPSLECLFLDRNQMHKGSISTLSLLTNLKVLSLEGNKVFQNDFGSDFDKFSRYICNLCPKLVQLDGVALQPVKAPGALKIFDPSAPPELPNFLNQVFQCFNTAQLQHLVHAYAPAAIVSVSCAKRLTTLTPLSQVNRNLLTNQNAQPPTPGNVQPMLQQIESTLQPICNLDEVAAECRKLTGKQYLVVVNGKLGNRNSPNDPKRRFQFCRTFHIENTSPGNFLVHSDMLHLDKSSPSSQWYAIPDAPAPPQLPQPGSPQELVEYLVKEFGSVGLQAAIAQEAVQSVMNENGQGDPMSLYSMARSKLLSQLQG